MRAILVTTLAAVALAGCGGHKSPPVADGGTDGGGDPCQGVSGTCVAFTAGATEQAIGNAFNQATPGTTLAFGPGSYHFSNTIEIGSVGLTVQGAGIDVTIFDFTGQTGGADGIDALDGSNQLTLTGFTVQNSAGNALKVEGSTNVVYRAVKTTWTSSNDASHGPYGIYPIQAQNVLIENCVITGASDSGIYVGQSQNVIVRNNEVYGNVAGIEVENSYDVDVTGNNSHDNTGGILVFDLPQLQQEGGHAVRVFNNQIVNNNLANFGAVGDIVSEVPAGTGLFVMANHDVEAFGNTIAGSSTASMAVASYYVAEQPINDPTYYPFPFRVYLHDNTVMDGGTSPDPTKNIGLLLLTGMSAFPGGHVPDMIYDGVIDPAVAADAGTLPDGGAPVDPMQICFHQNGAATFADMHLDQLNDAGTNLAQIFTTDQADFDCQLPALPPIVLPDAGS
ncbi:MAG: parallel beta-helix domain-containing protein [Deltaproteobacteria bacterium]